MMLIPPALSMPARTSRLGDPRGGSPARGAALPASSPRLSWIHAAGGRHGTDDAGGPGTRLASRRRGPVRAGLSPSLPGWFFQLPWGVGLATACSCPRVALGISPSDVPSAGNGAAMRAAISGTEIRRERFWIQMLTGEEILALVAGDRGASPFKNGFEPWIVRGGCKPPLKRTFFPRLVCSPRAVSRCPLGRVDRRQPPARSRPRPHAPPGSASFVIQPTSPV
jgi:hypothetical protein